MEIKHHNAEWITEKIILYIFCLIFLSACSESPETLQQVKQRGVIRVLSTNSPNSWYIDPLGNHTGLEYELASRFAAELGVELELIAPDSFADLFRLLDAEQGDFIASGITITEQRKQLYNFGPAYQTITEVLVYKQGNRRPENIDDLGDGSLIVIDGSSYQERLSSLKKGHPNLTWIDNDSESIEQLLEKVWLQEYDYTIADSNIFNQARRLYPDLRRAFDLSEPQQLAWTFPKNTNPELHYAAASFFHRLKASGELQRIIDRYYSHVETFDYVDARTFLEHYNDRLPSYQILFEKTARLNDMDWHLLAAIAYQESHWRPDAVSPTGVRGMMMLTLNTAKMMEVKDRNDAAQSISGGARYLQRMRGKIPDRIAEPNRTWFALAAYNVGYGHLEDARIITEKQGGNPDLWVDVKKSLPLLSKKKWYSKTRYGFARGAEPVRYVENIRRYHDVLIRLSLLSDVQPKSFEQIVRDSLVF